MGISDKLQVEGGISESEGQRWVIAGISLRAPLKPIITKPPPEKLESAVEEDRCYSTTPTGQEVRIRERLVCPPAPRKRRALSRCRLNGVREFFTPPDLDSVFIRRVERAT